MAIRSMQRIIKDKPWGERLFDCNYRGDYVTQAKRKARSARRRGAVATSNVDLQELTDLKHSVCPKFIIRLEADRVELPFYEEQAIARGVPLTIGIGSRQIDSNSIGNLEVARQEIHKTVKAYVAAIKNVFKSIDQPYDKYTRQPWPSHVYFEDISAESQFEMIEIIIQTVKDNG